MGEQLSTNENWKRAIKFAAKSRTKSFSNEILITRRHLAVFKTGRVLYPGPMAPSTHSSPPPP